MQKNVILKPGERLDDLQINDYKIIQDPKKFCFGMDAVLLSAFADLRKGDNVLDLGTGTGIIPILLCAKSKAAHFDAIEILEDSVDMARRSIELNGLCGRINAVCGDMRQASEIFKKQSYDAITANPPYINDGHGLVNRESQKAVARHEILCTLSEVVREASALLKPRGKLLMVHKPFRLAEIFTALGKYSLEPKRLRLVYPYIDKEPNMALIEAVKGGAPMLKVEPPIIVYESSNVYTKQILEFYGILKKR